MYWTTTIAGCLLVVWGLLEVFIGVLYPRALSGPLAGGLSHLSQRIAAAIWRSWPCRMRSAISLVGPVLVVAQVICWGLLLWIGFSLIAWPHLGESIVASGDRETPTDFFSAMYVMGFSLTTLGVGDMMPISSAMQLLMVAQAAIGFSFFTLVLSYVMSVYSALVSRNRLALSIECSTRCTGDPYVYLRSALRRPPESVVRAEEDLADALLDMLESHQFYPVLHYFRFPHPAYALPRMLYFCLEVATVSEVLRSEADADVTPPFGANGKLWYAANTLLSEIAENFSRHGSDAAETIGPTTALERLLRDAESIGGRSFTESADFASRYRNLRHHWLGSLRAISRSQGAEQMIAAQIEEAGFEGDRCEASA